MLNRDACPVCRVGMLKPAGPAFTDTKQSPPEMKVLFRCTECGFSEERAAEPTGEVS